MDNTTNNLKTIIIFGGSGLIGQHLCKMLSKEYEVIIVSRDPESLHLSNAIKLRNKDYQYLVPFFNKAYGIINLAGENIHGRWTKYKKTSIRDSRLNIDCTIVQAFRACTNKPKFLMQGSNINIYGFSRRDREITEDSQLGKHGFSTKISKDHERAFKQLEKLTRVIYLRTGMVLAPDDIESLKQHSLPKSFIRWIMGTGQQWKSWIHIMDLTRAINFLISQTNTRGPYNLTAPMPIKQKVFVNTIKSITKRATLLQIPSFVLRIIKGEMANELLLQGLNVKPQKLLDDSFHFQFENLDYALKEIYS